MSLLFHSFALVIPSKSNLPHAVYTCCGRGRGSIENSGVHMNVHKLLGLEKGPQRLLDAITTELPLSHLTKRMARHLHTSSDVELTTSSGSLFYLRTLLQIPSSVWCMCVCVCVCLWMEVVMYMCIYETVGTASHVLTTCSKEINYDIRLSGHGKTT